MQSVLCHNISLRGNCLSFYLLFGFAGWFCSRGQQSTTSSICKLDLNNDRSIVYIMSKLCVRIMSSAFLFYSLFTTSLGLSLSVWVSHVWSIFHPPSPPLALNFRQSIMGLGDHYEQPTTFECHHLYFINCIFVYNIAKWSIVRPTNYVKTNKFSLKDRFLNNYNHTHQVIRIL